MNYANEISPDNGGNAKTTKPIHQTKHRKLLGTNIRYRIKQNLSSGNVIMEKRMAKNTLIKGEPEDIERLAIVVISHTGSHILSIEKMLSGKGKPIGKILTKNDELYQLNAIQTESAVIFINLFQ